MRRLLYETALDTVMISNGVGSALAAILRGAMKGREARVHRDRVSEAVGLRTKHIARLQVPLIDRGPEKWPLKWRTQKIMTNSKWRNYTDAERWARSLKLKNQAAWQKLPRSAVPADIPKDPWKAYGEEFQNWGAWLGTETVSNKNKRNGFLPYAEAKLYVHRLNVTSQAKWLEYWETHEKPSFIPYDPPAVYGHEWENWGKWFGTNYVAHRFRVYCPFTEARLYARSLGIAGSTPEWLGHWKTHERPNDIPSDPRVVYRNEWKGWHNFFGGSRRLTKMAVDSILDDLIPQLPYLNEAELYTILQRSGILSELSFMEKVSPMEMLQLILREGLQRIKQRVKNRTDEYLKTAPGGDGDGRPRETEDGFATAEGEDPEGLKYDTNCLTTVDDLKLVDKLANSEINLPCDVIEDLVNNRVAALWDSYGHSPDIVHTLLENEGGHWYGEIRRRFHEQLEEVKDLPVPLGWSFSVGGRLVLPNAMQCLTAIRVRDGRRVMNLSAAGTGKTAAAILASRVTGAKLTVVVTNLSTVDGWKKEISCAFPDAPMFTNVEECARATDAENRYLLVNYDKFQGFSHAIVTKIADQIPDFLVLDEMHFVKQRSNDPSQRRVAVGKMIELITAGNPDLRVLGMSATASINNLREPKKLLELVTGQQFNHLKTKVTVDNAMAMHHAMSKHSFRFHYRSQQELKEHTIRTTWNDMLTDLLNMDGSILGVERLLLGARLDAARPHLKRGTIIYTHYIAGIVETIKEYLAGLGLTAGVYTGSEKTGIEAFGAQEVDVLIGSAPVAVGLNGLQYVSNCLVVVSLPWTYAHYEQLVGRIHRQGSPFSSAEVIVPLVTVEVNGHEWSWDQERMRLLQMKRTLSDCVLDGIIPEMIKMSHEDLLRQSRETLNRWVEEVAEAKATETNGTAMQSG